MIPYSLYWFFLFLCLFDASHSLHKLLLDDTRFLLAEAMGADFAPKVVLCFSCSCNILNLYSGFGHSGCVDRAYT